MIAFRHALIAGGLSLAANLAFTEARAAEVYYVSGDSTATTGCSSTAPCRSIFYALQVAAPGDVIVCLSSPARDYFEITKSITIDCSAAKAPITTYFQGEGLRVGLRINIPSNAPEDPLRTVRLRGLTIDGGVRNSYTAGGRFLETGIDIVSAAVVHIEDSVISNTRQYGIFDRRTGGQTRLYVKDSFVSGVNGPGIVAAAQGTAAAVLDNVRVENNVYGVAAAVGNNVIVNRSVISGNSTAGVHADSGAQIEVINSVMSHNTTNVQAFGKIRLQENAIKFSNTAIVGSQAVSMGLNRFSGNGTLGAPLAFATGAPSDVID